MLKVAKRPEEKKRAIAVLAEVSSIDSLALLCDCTKDASLAKDATAAAVRLAAQIAKRHPQQLADVQKTIRARAASEEIKKEIENALPAAK